MGIMSDGEEIAAFHAQPPAPGKDCELNVLAMPGGHAKMVLAVRP